MQIVFTPFYITTGLYNTISSLITTIDYHNIYTGWEKNLNKKQFKKKIIKIKVKLHWWLLDLLTKRWIYLWIPLHNYVVNVPIAVYWDQLVICWDDVCLLQNRKTGEGGGVKSENKIFLTPPDISYMIEIDINKFEN